MLCQMRRELLQVLDVFVFFFTVNRLQRHKNYEANFHNHEYNNKDTIKFQVWHLQGLFLLSVWLAFTSITRTP